MSMIGAAELHKAASSRMKVEPSDAQVEYLF